MPGDSDLSLDLEEKHFKSAFEARVDCNIEKFLGFSI